MKTSARKLKDHPAAPWVFLAAILFPANLYMLYHMRGPGALADINGRQLYRQELPADAARDLDRVEHLRYATLERRVHEWAAPIALEKEAKLTGKTPEQLIAEEVAKTAQVSDAEVWDRYRRAPAADLRPLEQALSDIRKALEAEKSAAAKTAYRTELLRKHGLRIHAAKPASYTGPPQLFFYPSYFPPAAADLSQGVVTGPPSRGSSAADAVVLEIYSDFLCPFSRRFAGTMKELEARYPERLRVVYRHYPLPMHAGAEVLAEASVCAQEQGKFWEMHDVYMAWEGAPDAGRLTDAAAKAGIDPQKFTSCLSQRRYRNFVKQEMNLAQTRGVGSTPTFFLNGRKTTGALQAGQVAPLIDWFEKKAETEYPGKAYDKPAQPPVQPNTPPPAPTGPAEFSKDWLKLGPSRGPASAPVTVIEFVDLNCPFCQKGALAVDPIVKASPSPIRFLSRQFPLGMHPNAEKASVAALCAEAQGKYWEYRDEIFGASWGKQTPEDLKAAASKAGLNRGKFDKCFDASQTLDRVRQDVAAGSGAGVTGTPTYFVNGQRVVGANPDAVKKLIEEAAATAKK